MKLNKAIAKFVKAGATMTTQKLSETTIRYIATFPNGKKIDFTPDAENNVDTYARPYGYDEANQSDMCFYYDSAKKAIERVLATY